MYIHEHNLFHLNYYIMDRFYLASYKQTPEHNTRLDIKLHKLNWWLSIFNQLQHWKLL